MRCLIRADASAETGSGHVMRILGLAQGLRDQGHEVSFLQKCPQALRDRLRSDGFASIGLPAAPGSSEDAAVTIDLARQMNATWVIADGYSFDAAYQDAVQSSGFRLLLVDDNGDADGYPADLVLNQSLHADPSLYGSCYDSRRFLLGGGYALLRDEFRSWIGHERVIADSPRRLLVSLGGLPNPAWFSVVVDAVAETNLEVCVVGGIPSDWANHLDQHQSVKLLPSVENMAELIMHCDIGLTAGGGTTREFLFFGLPFAVVDVAENQALQSRFLGDEGLAIRLGPLAELEPHVLKAAIRLLATDRSERVRLSRAGQERVDGLGVDRVITELTTERDDRDKPPRRT